MEPNRSSPAFWRELAWIAPVLLAVLVLPPVLTLFDVPRTVFGVPVLLVYLFCVWVIALVASFCVARMSLRDSQPGGD